MMSPRVSICWSPNIDLSNEKTRSAAAEFGVKDHDKENDFSTIFLGSTENFGKFLFAGQSVRFCKKIGETCARPKHLQYLK